MSGHTAALVGLIALCLAGIAGIAISKWIEQLCILAQRRIDNKQFEQDVAEALAAANHPAFIAAARETSERLFSEEDAAWLARQGISR